MQIAGRFPMALGLAMALAALPVAAQPDFEAIGDRVADRLPEMADRLFQSMGGRIIRTLTDSGLPQADSEEIARRYAANFAECARSAFMIEAERQSISLNELLARLFEVTYVGNVDLSDPAFDPVQNVSKVLDVHSMNANLVPCVIGAMQEAGISLQSGLDALPESARIDSQ